MTLNLIGIGLGDEKDITLRGLELIKKSDLIYLENYTSKLNCDISKLEELYQKKIIPADRDLVENKDEIITNAESKKISLLIIGDVLGATTHLDIIQRAKEKNIRINIVHNASILNTISETGLSLYNFGKVTSIPFENKNIKSPIKAFDDNQKNGLHTLFLLDLKPDEDKFMQIDEAIEYLIKNNIKEETHAIACCALGSKKQMIKFAALKELKDSALAFNVFPQCLVIPGKMHFTEEEFIENFR
ncbi:MAG: diphthine synthase [Candidatus Heimdallarchaeota archaeon]|nr:diphthine synthase [Candidatus Heimdallarchaeota archaeon]